MKLYATVSSERATKGQGGNDYLKIVLLGAHETELACLTLKPDGAGYVLNGWTHNDHRIEHKIDENIEKKGKKQKGECDDCLAGYCLEHYHG